MKKRFAKPFWLFLLLSVEAIGQTITPAGMLTEKGRYIHSDFNGKTYQLFVNLPDHYNAGDTAHYPVLYVLDGFYAFPLAYSTQMLLALDKQIQDVIIVSIADSVLDKRTWFISRYSDFTPSRSAVTDSSTEAEYHLPRGSLTSGGASAFLMTIERQIIPFINDHYKTTADRGIAGHSMGALFSAYCLLTTRGIFRRYGINSPSLYWDNGMLFNLEKMRSRNDKVLDAQVFMSEGSLENKVKISDMVRFASSLKKHNYKGLTLSTYIFDGENHMSVIPAMLCRTLRILYGADE